MSDLYASRRIRTPEQELSAVLLRMVLDHCARPEGTLDSFGRLANAEAMRVLAEDGFIRIDEETGDRLRATVLPQAESFLAWMAKALGNTAADSPDCYARIEQSDALVIVPDDAARHLAILRQLAGTPS